MKLPNPRRMYERARWLRSDGKPNFRTVVREKEPELRSLIVPEVPVASPQTPLLRCLEEMRSQGFRAIVVVKAGEIAGLLTFHDIADYIGGGSRFKIVAERYGGNIYKALTTPSQELMSRNVVYVETGDTLGKVLELMVSQGLGLIPVLDPSRGLAGVITEGSIVRAYSGRVSRKPVSEVMTKTVITAGEDSTIHEVLKLMVSMGVRRIPLLSKDSKLTGVVTWRGLVEIIGSHRVFELAGSGFIQDFLKLRAVEFADSDIVVVEPTTPLEVLVSKMFERNLDYAIVVEDETLRGIVTERDIMYSILAS